MIKSDSSVLMRFDKRLYQDGVAGAVIGMKESGEFFVAGYRLMLDEVIPDDQELDILSRSTLSVFDQYVKLNKKVPAEILTSLAGIDEPSRLSDCWQGGVSV